MKYGTISGVSRPVSRVIFGTAHPVIERAAASVHGGECGFQEARDAAFSLLDAAYEMGINTFDCAHHYGEEQLGDWAESRGVRDNIVILTKGGHHNAFRKRVTPFDILSDFHDSLAKLKTDHIDLYMLHRDDENMPVGMILETLARLKADGKISAYGASNWTVARLEEAANFADANGIARFSASSPNYGLAEQVADPWGGGCVSVAGPAAEGDRAWYRANGLPVIAYSALARGFFSGRFRAGEPAHALAVLDAPTMKGYFCRDNVERLRRCEVLAREKGCHPGDIALSYLFSRGEVDAYAALSAGTREHLSQDVAASEMRLSGRECDWVNLLTDEA